MECGDCEGMAEIVWCIEHPAEAEQLGINSRKLAEEKFDRRVIDGVIYKIIFSEK